MNILPILTTTVTDMDTYMLLFNHIPYLVSLFMIIYEEYFTFNHHTQYEIPCYS